MEYDVVVIGGGIIGNITAKEIKGDVLIVEEHQSIGFPLQCAGIISKKCYESLEKPKGVVNKVRGAYIHTIKNTLKIESEKDMAYVMERKVMDKDIAIKAAKKCDILLKSYAEVEENKVIIKHGGEVIEIQPEVIVSAEGVRARTGMKLGLLKGREVLSACQFEMVNVKNIDDDFVHIFLDKRYSENFFVWIIPLEEDRVRVGLLDKGGGYNKLLKFINNKSEMFKNTSIVEFSVGALPIGYLKKTVKDNILLVGDSACHVKPLSGGGIYYGSLGGRIAGRVINEYLNGSGDLRRYDKEWRKEFGEELKTSLMIRKLFLKMGNETIDEIIKRIKDSDLVDYINKYGDMEKQSIIALKVLKSLGLSLGLKLIKEIL
ncbi:geranylgeranyl reductase [Methanocaldococcus villosus KIN24-T80]|uniref:Geranylgeranyl reductase n=1 Tax=Methanocaldococcus villosus KIN24-T80 TaxID=1069083 RepID=N6VTB0_9EURY|nr:NAD(P)/FAD-dependent oxidoreductase [Methanocaldococcus villosus]ENN96431.1 geranylgeranyl reductase [Methanocaldococcus villosus KIN24-T80]